ncbi:MAG: ABC transporter-related protein [Candidatus Magasanikbacteria bacterium GW2011_GWC2_37_14]|uniref:ABC transporter-related protein n=1 Tax=Candidatus Magasanikbacteria bacterium GW2011_GWC2_37_14 TaxID=1619046 RepID=A0A0G0GNB0_9BACT|nr:MAG: ABC transporter-related protein [Candidatus Magasanikbacteria bacterium GW2011_GWC2_37_14]
MQSNVKATLRYYWQHLKVYPKSGWIMLLATIFVWCVNTYVPLYYKKFFDLLTNPGPTAVIAPLLIKILLVVALLEFVAWILFRLNTFFASYFQAKIMADLSRTCFSYLHKHSIAFFHNNFVGSLVKRVNRFTRSFESIADKTIFNIIPLIVQVILIIVIITRNHWQLGVGMLVWVIVFMGVNWLFVRFKLPHDIKRSDLDSKVSGVLADTFTNHTNIKLFNGYKQELGDFSKVVDSLGNIRLFTWNLSNVFEAVQGLLAITLELGLLYFGVQLWRVGLFTVGDFVLVQSYVISLFMRLWDFGRLLQHIFEDLADAAEMTEMLEKEHDIKDIRNAKDLIVNKGEIEFKNVTFDYNETRTILSHFNLIIKPQEKVALVGPSGAGKSTIVRLIQRLYDLSGGKILINDQNIAKVTLESLWQATSLVPQDPVLFHRTLRENIRYGKPDATDADVEEAAKLAYCHDFISELSEGYNTFVGERGIKLSGGERQRVAIARAILHNAPILILDEATSSLDSESESLIQAALNNLMKGKTVIVIAHRLSTIMKMDRILVIENGKLQEEGTHEKLLKKKNGLYSRLWNLQAGGFIE